MADRILSEVLEIDLDRCEHVYGVSPCTAGISHSGTATAGSATTLTLAAGASASDDAYNGSTLALDDASGREALITDYVGATKVATVSPRWAVNLLTYSNAPDNAAWTKVGGMGVAANGSAWDIEDDDGAGYEYLQQAVTVADDSADYVLSVRVEKATAKTNAGLLFGVFSGGTGVNFGVYFNPNTGAVLEGYGAGSNDVGFHDEGAHWRFWVRLTNNGTGNTTLTCELYPAINALPLNTTNDATETGTLTVNEVQLDLATDIGTYVATVATAFGVPSTEDYSVIARSGACYNTFTTCQDKTNYSATTHTIRFTKRGAPVEPGVLVRPYITDISRAPTEINIEEGYAQRAVTTVRVADEPDADVDEDPYFATRATPAQGTFWTRLLARSPNYQYRPARLVRAFVNAGVWGSTRTEKYIVDEIRGPNTSGVMTVTLKDPLKKVDRIKIPAPTDGKLLADLPGASHTGTAQGGTVNTIILAPDASAVDDAYNGQEVYLTGGDGVGQRRVASDYVGATRTLTVSSNFAVVPTAVTVYEVAPLELDVGTAYVTQYRDPGVTGDREYVAVGDEIIEYTAVSSGKLQWTDGSYRAAFGTTREDHNADDTVQQCWVKFGETFTQTVQDILTDSGIASGDIDTAGFAAEEGEWLGDLYKITCCITEPTDGDDLVEELLPLAQSVIWWDPVEQKVKLQVLLPDYAGASQAWTDADTFISESVQVDQLSDLRLTRAALVFGLRNYTAADDEARNYSNSEIVVDTDAESANEYGDVRPEVVYSRWFQQANRVAAHAWAARKVVNYRDVPKRLEAEFDPKDAPIAIGSQATVTTRYLTDVTGAAKATRVIVTRVSDLGGRIRVRMRAMATTKQNGDAKRYAYIAPNGTADHPTETTYAHIADTSTVLMGDGSDPYLII